MSTFWMKHCFYVARMTIYVVHRGIEKSAEGSDLFGLPNVP